MNNHIDHVHFVLCEPVKNYKKRFYTPQFSEMAHDAVQRLSWAMGESMGEAVDAIIHLLPAYLNKEKICNACKDNSKCSTCIFNSEALTPLKLLDLIK